jgi:phosphatidylglycerophosphatase A
MGTSYSGPLGLRMVASFLLVGEKAPIAPATFASFLCLPFLYFYLDAPVWSQIVLTLLVTWIAIPVSTRAERVYGHDGSPIVIDEVAGMLVTFLAIPVEAHDLRGRLIILLIGFFLFRFTDIVKPFPAGRAQRLPGGTGVVMDDFFAGIYANVLLRICLILF